MYNQNKCKLRMNHFVLLYGCVSVTSTYAMKYLSMYKLIIKQEILDKITCTYVVVYRTVFGH